jgi:HEAT repeat protein
MTTREQIEQAKRQHDTAFFRQVLDTRQGTKALLQVLEQLGRLPPDFDPTPLLPLLDHAHPEVRLAAVKALARLENPHLLPLLAKRVQTESNTRIRRELVSAIGRLRLADAIPILCDCLNDPDPKVVLQAVRGLLCFRDRAEVQRLLMPLQDHPNELVRSVIQREFRQEEERHRATCALPHPVSPNWLKNLMVCADVREMLALVPSESVHLTFT